MSQNNDMPGSPESKRHKPNTDVVEVDKTENKKIRKTGKRFLLKHTFKNILGLEVGKNVYSKKEEHFGVQWYFCIEHAPEDFLIVLYCSWPKSIGESTIKEYFEFKFGANTGDTTSKKFIATFRNNNGSDSNGFQMKWSKLESDFVEDGKLKVELNAEVLESTGLFGPRLRNFDETTKEVSDLILVVNGEKFYVSKFYLSSQSDYFRALFLRGYSESSMPEIKLEGIDADDFQHFLVLLYGEKVLDEITVEGILLIADMYNTPVAIRQCEDFLLDVSKKTLKKKFQMAIRYNLEKLKTKILADVKTISDIREIAWEEEVDDLEPSIISTLLKKAISDKQSCSCSHSLHSIV
ncbi:hypothetical protein GCK72_007609 [Caenorhabditis remanei]|uniref:BTB domain-containing protein n=1 Tax=Caenorhabditis remanei TaxID=31234 RepID=A0A6A5HHQ8_CAERE|nr:hypothetical protein GCK72_007609 [Caenorhabditis remanei]KAF1767650.1 hypothetical protein GCK72_007609 [Caenorhabditis remanei]